MLVKGVACYKLWWIIEIGIPVSLFIGTARVEYKRSQNGQYALNYKVDSELLDYSKIWLQDLRNQNNQVREKYMQRSNNSFFLLEKSYDTCYHLISIQV